MIIHVLVEEFRGGGSLICGADIDEATLIKQRTELESKANDSFYRIAEVELTSKRRLLENLHGN